MALTNATLAYTTSEWSVCDSACGPGNSSREVLCTHTATNVTFDASVCVAAGLGAPPASTMACMLHPWSYYYGFQDDDMSTAWPHLMALGTDGTEYVPANPPPYYELKYALPASNHYSIEVKMLGNSSGELGVYVLCSGCTDGECVGKCVLANPPTYLYLTDSSHVAAHRVVVQAMTYPPSGSLWVTTSYAKAFDFFRLQVRAYMLLQSSVDVGASTNVTDGPLSYVFTPALAAVGLYFYVTHAPAVPSHAHDYYYDDTSSTVAGATGLQPPSVFATIAPIGSNVATMNVEWPTRTRFNVSSTRSAYASETLLLTGDAFVPSPHLFVVFPSTVAAERLTVSAVDIIQLKSGVPFQGTTPAGGFALFVFTPPAVVTAITVTLVSNTGVADVYGDADLFVGTAPFVPQYGPNCSCFASSTYTASYSAVDEVRMDNTQFTWTTAVYIAVYGYGSASVTYTLTAYSYQVHTASQTTVLRSVTCFPGSATRGSCVCVWFPIAVPSRLRLRIWRGRGLLSSGTWSTCGCVCRDRPFCLDRHCLRCRVRSPLTTVSRCRPRSSRWNTTTTWAIPPPVCPSWRPTSPSRRPCTSRPPATPSSACSLARGRSTTPR